MQILTLGAQIGNVVVLPLAGFLCENLGWASIFYVIGRKF